MEFHVDFPGLPFFHLFTCLFIAKLAVEVGFFLYFSSWHQFQEFGYGSLW